MTIVLVLGPDHVLGLTEGQAAALIEDGLAYHPTILTWDPEDKEDVELERSDILVPFGEVDEEMVRQCLAEME